MPVPPTKRAEVAKLTRAYKAATAKERAEAEADAPILAHLRVLLAASSPCTARSWVGCYAPHLTVNARTRLAALRLLAEWHERQTRALSDPLFDEPDDFWLWARALLKRENPKMALTVMLTGDNLADVLRQAAKLAAEGVEGVPGMKQVAHTAAAEPVAAVVVPAEKPKPPAPPSIDDVRTAMSAALKVKDGEATIAQVLKGHGADKLSALDPVHYAAVIAELKMAL